MHTRTPRAPGRWAPVLAATALLAACGAGPAPELGPALTLAEAGASIPTTAVDPRSGAVYVAWIADGDIRLARSDDHAGFAAPVRVNDVPGDAAPHDQAPAQVAVGPEGNVYVAWQNNTRIEGRRFPASDLRFARSTDGGRTFEPALTVTDDADGPPSSHTFHDIAVAPDGRVDVSWIDSRERARLEAELRLAGRDVDPEAMPGPEIRVATSSDGGRSFAPSVVVDRESCPCCRTASAVGPDGTLYIAWRKVFAGNVRDIVVARSTDGGASFDPPVRVHHDEWVLDACPHAGPAIAVDDGRRLHVAWYTGREDRPGLFYAVSDDGGRSFDPPTPLAANGWVPPSQVRLAADGPGVWIAWEERADGGISIRLARADPRGRLGRATDPASGRAPALARAGATRALAWLDGEALRVRIGGTQP